ncbi:MAG: sodium/proline symporter [Salinivirgaceae bacterium]|jgi:sodium/proline symporter|nr:sodium/proline symporter [Salinivirgaceae bacterium]
MDLYTTQLLVVMIAYLLLLLLYGIYHGRNVKSSGDYAIAERKLPGWVAALSERATGESSWALLGLPGAAYATGLIEIWTALGCVVGVITTWILLAWRLRDAAEELQVTTFTEFIAKRHGTAGKWIRIVGSSTIVFFFFFYVGAQFLGGGKTLHTMFNIDAKLGMVLTAAIVVPYTIYGGFRSVVYTDVIQSIMMIVTLVVGPIVGIKYIASNPELFANTIGDAIRLAGPAHASLTGSFKGFTAGMAIVGGFSWFFGYLGGQPQLSTRFMAIKDAKQAKQARNIGVIWTIVAYIGALCIGWIGIAIFGPNGLQDREYVMPAVLLEIFPPTIAAILIAGAIAAMHSTADSLLIVSASELSENLIKPLIGKKIFEKRPLLISRIITAVLAVIALAIAYFGKTDLIFNDYPLLYPILNT